MIGRKRSLLWSRHVTTAILGFTPGLSVLSGNMSCDLI